MARMSIGDYRCDDCGSKEAVPYVGEVAKTRMCLCRRCAGKAVKELIGYIRDFDRSRKPPRFRPKTAEEGAP